MVQCWYVWFILVDSSPWEEPFFLLKLIQPCLRFHAGTGQASGVCFWSRTQWPLTQWPFDGCLMAVWWLLNGYTPKKYGYVMLCRFYGFCESPDEKPISSHIVTIGCWSWSTSDVWTNPDVSSDFKGPLGATSEPQPSNEAADGVASWFRGWLMFHFGDLFHITWTSIGWRLHSNFILMPYQKHIHPLDKFSCIKPQ